MSSHVEHETLREDPPATAARGTLGSPLSDKVRSLRIAQPQSRGGGSALAWTLCLVLAGLSGWLGYLVYEKQREADEARAMAAEAKPAESAARTSETTLGNGAVVHESKGYIVPTHKILVSPKVNGMVKYLRIQQPGQPPQDGIPLEEGMHVREGDILAQLESTDYEADVARARAVLAATEFKLDVERKNLPNEIERAEAELREASTSRDYLKTVVERNEKLAKTVAVSPNEIEKSKSEYDSAMHKVARLQQSLELVHDPRVERILLVEAEVKQSRADLVKAEWRLGNCLIVAPVSGTILKKNVEEGNIVNPVAFNGSFSVCEMADLADLEVDLSIQERDISRVFAGQKCVVRAEAYPERAYEGVVSRLMPIADRAKGAIPVRVKVTVPADEEGVYLKPEMGAVVSFYGSAPPAAAKPEAGQMARP